MINLTTKHTLGGFLPGDIIGMILIDVYKI